MKLAYDGVRLTVTTTTGTELVMPQEALANLDFNLGKLTFLSGMVPTKIVEKSGIGLVHSFRRDKNLDDEQIYLDRAVRQGPVDARLHRPGIQPGRQVQGVPRRPGRRRPHREPKASPR